MWNKDRKHFTMSVSSSDICIYGAGNPKVFVVTICEQNLATS